ncbi:hypothetical protein [Paludisphaera borealis]|uniref:Tail terminator n=1 Tax=Paludisphaera borealis TaxID=1387353 RepID=A0A1U7CX60_9BACT|nr:hypothetical protein [Paludisphaera borealis]APW63540.1 hypothetical protein BSF38_05112 [Paludisphaera borealis]
MSGINIMGSGPLGTMDAPPAPGDIRASVKGVLQPLFPGVKCYPDAIDQGTGMPAILYRFENRQDNPVMGNSPSHGAKIVSSSGYVVFHSFDYSKPDAVQRAILIKQAFNGLRGPMGTVYVGSSFKLKDETDDELQIDDGSGRTIYEVRLTFHVGWCE